jgi:hypothetical protein
MKARQLLKIEWDKGPFANESDESLMQDFQRFCQSKEEGKVLLHEGDVDAVELERSHASEMDDVAVTLYIGDP